MNKKNSIEKPINNNNLQISELSATENEIILNAIPDVIIKFDNNKKLTWWNKKFTEIVSASGERLAEFYLSDLFIPYPGENISSIFKKTLEKGCFETDAFLTTDAGNKRYHLKCTLIEDAPLDNKEVLIVARDINARAELTDALNRSHSQLQKLVDSLPFFISITTPHDEYLLANKKYCEFIGLLPSEIIGFNNKDIFPENLAEYFTRDNEKILLEKRSLHYESLVEINNNGVILSFDKFPLFDESNKIYAICSVAEDVTAQYQMQRQLQQTQKMEAIGQLTGGIAHDFNNILASIMGYTGLIKRRAIHNNDETVKGYLNQITRSGERARDLVQQLLAFSRGDVGDLQILEPEPLAKEAMKMLASVIPSSINLNLKIRKNNLKHYIEADPVQFNQSLMNLVINSKDAIVDETGHIDVSLEYMPHVKGVCDSCHVNFSGKYIQLAVSDSGEGINKDILGKIFDPFFTTKDIGKGSGMGLSMLHGIVHGSGGHIIVNSASRKSSKTKTTIKVFFPEVNVKNVEEESGLYNVKHSRASKSDGKNILLIDDETSITCYLNDLLIDVGYKVVSFNNSIEGLNHFKKNHSDINLIITNQTMPDLTGIELAKNILELKQEIPIILCTGYSDFANGTVTSDYGIDVIINKPFENDILLQNIGRLLKQYQKQIH